MGEENSWQGWQVVLEVSVVEGLPGELEATLGVFLFELELLGAQLFPLFIADLESRGGEGLAGCAMPVSLEPCDKVMKFRVILGIWHLE